MNIIYLYSLYGFEENAVIIHDKQFTEEEFKQMCKEAPLFIYGDHKSYETTTIREYLIEKYGFKEAKYTTKFFVDANVEE